MIRKAKSEDMDRILKIYENARAFMASAGNPHQWANGYPQRKLVEDDLHKEQLYVYETEEGIEAVFVYFKGIEPNYEEIENGRWLNEEPYGVLHRIAVAQQGKGIASVCLDWCYQDCGNMRGDTHRKNKTMQRLFEKNGFIKCGIVRIEDGTERIAYHKATETVEDRNEGKPE